MVTRGTPTAAHITCLPGLAALTMRGGLFYLNASFTARRYYILVTHIVRCCRWQQHARCAPYRATRLGDELAAKHDNVLLPAAYRHIASRFRYMTRHRSLPMLTARSPACRASRPLTICSHLIRGLAYVPPWTRTGSFCATAFRFSPATILTRYYYAAQRFSPLFGSATLITGYFIACRTRRWLFCPWPLLSRLHPHHTDFFTA